MRRRNIKPKTKVGIQCPSCGDEIFSMYRHDFRRCYCGKVFIDGGDDYMRCGADQSIDLSAIKNVMKPYKEAARLMTPEVRDSHPMPPPPQSFKLRKPTYQIVWWSDMSDWTWFERKPYPTEGQFKGAIYQWRIQVGPLEIRRWAE